MNKKLLLAGACALGLLASCDNGVISGDSYAEVTFHITPWGGVYDSVWVDIRKGSYRGPLRATLKSTDTSDYYNTLFDPDQMQHSTGLPKGEWVLVATYFKTIKDAKDTSKVLGTAHRFAVAQATVDVVYDSECECRVLEGDFANLVLKD
jgi:hypothetical protein